MSELISRRVVLGRFVKTAAALTLPEFLAGDRSNMDIYNENETMPTFVSYDDDFQSIPITPLRNDQFVGASWSWKQLKYVKLTGEYEPIALSMLKFSGIPVVRLSSNMQENITDNGKFDFTNLEKRLDVLQSLGIQVILPLGIKAAFSWPEFYPDKQIQQAFSRLPKGSELNEESIPGIMHHLEDYVGKTMEIVMKYQDIIQLVTLENEPFSPSGEKGITIGEKIIALESRIVKESGFKGKIIINELLKGSASDVTRIFDEGIENSTYAHALQYADILGLDFYPIWPSHSLGRNTIYQNTLHSPYMQYLRTQIGELVKNNGKDIMFLEVQAEPNEKNNLQIYPLHQCPSSLTPTRLIQNFEECKKVKQSRGFMAYGLEHQIAQSIYWDPKAFKKYFAYHKNELSTRDEFNAFLHYQAKKGMSNPQVFQAFLRELN